MRHDPADLVPQGDPETVVLLPNGQGSLVGLLIRGVESQTMLGIREDELGRPEGCAITNELQIDTSRVQSNPRRVVDPPPSNGDEA